MEIHLTVAFAHETAAARTEHAIAIVQYNAVRVAHAATGFARANCTVSGMERSRYPSNEKCNPAGAALLPIGVRKADQVPIRSTHSTMRWHKWVVLIAPLRDNMQLRREPKIC
jgi:hypothetical protein